VLLDERSANGRLDGRVDRVFRLQAKYGTIDPVNVRPSEATVTWDRTAVAIDLGEQAITLAAKPTDRALRSDVILHGFGLAHFGDWGISLPATLDDRGFESLRARLFSRLLRNCSNFTCYAGGPGSTGCSYSCGGQQCSVTCSAPKFACCGCHGTEHPCCMCTEGGFEG
jgi:hypothetical protein